MSLTLPAEEAGHEHHDHPAWLAHHFDDAEQQFDAGKLGMWLFLVTEVLFFSGMFCAYALYRSQHPEVWEFASHYLNKFLGAINTGVLLFSSLTMAWAVRAAQLSQHRTCVGMLGATLSCAAIFLGVKAVEYTHKWNLGLLPAREYIAQIPSEHHDHSNFWLITLCVPAGIVLLIATVWYCMTWASRDRVQREISGPILVAALCFFGGVGLGWYLNLEDVAGKAHGESHVVASVDSGHDDHGHEHNADHATTAAPASEQTAPTAVMVATTDPVSIPNSYDSQAFPKQVRISAAELEVPDPNENQKSKAGLFFSIYYAMTGVHAVHILAGMVVLTWLIVKAAKHEFHSKYFGPVDNVGLYWHLVDFIWIYLFPLLYLIT